MSEHSYPEYADHVREPAPADRNVKVAHLVFGLLFLGIVGIWALAQWDLINTDVLPVLAPAVLIAAGVIGLVASLANSRRRRDSDQTYDPAHDQSNHQTMEIR